MKASVNSKKWIRCAGVLALVVCMLMCLAGTAYADLAAVQADAEGVLQMNYTIKDDYGKEFKVSTGSCFLINEDTVVTCYHVINPSNAYAAYLRAYMDNADFQSSFGDLTELELTEKIVANVTYSVTVTRDVTVSATIINGSEEMDFAVLKLAQPIRNRTYLKIRSSADVKSAETVYALGFPENSDTKAISTYTSDDVTFSSGVVSKTQSVYEPLGKGTYIQTSCKISGGNSGGPMVDDGGNVVGICSNGQIYYENTYDEDGNVLFSTVTEDYFFAVAIDQVTEVLDALGIQYSPADASVPAPTAAPTEEPAPAEPTEEPVPTAEPVVEPTPEPNPDPDPNPGPNMTIIIAAVAAVVVVVAVVAIVLVTSKKKKAAPVQPPAAPAPASSQPTTPPAGQTGFRTGPATPATGGGSTVKPAGHVGETMILKQPAATALLVNGGTITRIKNGETVNITSDNIIIGRDDTADLWIKDNPYIGTRHVRLNVHGGETYITDLNSKNGTFINGKKIQPNTETKLDSGVKITLANEDFTFKK